jgi:iron complex outermembrane receptor protein
MAAPYPPRRLGRNPAVRRQRVTVRRAAAGDACNIISFQLIRCLAQQDKALIRTFSTSVAALALVVPAAAFAAAPGPQVAGSAEQAHPDSDQEIIVTGVRRQAGDVLGGVSVVDESKLTREVRPSIGETLASQPGVSSSSFGPTSSRPILRGLSGERVRILVDGIGSLDLSASDPDHAVSINPITAERIEVLRGPSALLFGSSAIGGVVNVVDKRIPRHLPDGKVGVDALVHYGSAANERSANLSIDVPLGPHFVAHADGSYSKYDDLHVGGFVLSEPLRRQALASSDPAIRALADLKGILPNTAGRSDDVAAGLAYVDGALNIGVSYTHHDALYGVPIRYSLDPAIEAEAPTIDARQDRGDARVNVPLSGFFELFEFRGGISRYRHSEIEEDGAVGSRFFTDGGEIRSDVVQRTRGGWDGTTGIQYLDTDVRIRGEEKYLPDSRARQLGLFTLQSLESGPVRAEAGLRVELARLRAEKDADLGTPQASRDFTAVSASLGGNYELVSGWRAGLALSHSERAPSIDELFSSGPHGGSQQFLIGNPGLSTERSNSAELSLHRTTGPVHVQGSLYYSRFDSFIYQAPTDAIEDGLPVYEYRQGKADYYGFEVEGDAKFGRAFGIDWGAELVADAVRATIENYGPAPLIPPFRILAALTASRGQVDGRIEAEHAFAHERIAPNETPTDGYTLVNAAIDWHPFSARPELTFSLQANNIFDVDARRSTSVLKDFAPLGGRDIRVSARLSY